VVGTKIRHFSIEEKLPRSGMGEVYRAHDEQLHRDVAIKFLPESLVGQRLAVSRFIREAQAGSSLNHPNIITILDAGTTKGRIADLFDYLRFILFGYLCARQHVRSHPGLLGRLFCWSLWRGGYVRNCSNVMEFQTVPVPARKRREASQATPRLLTSPDFFEFLPEVQLADSALEIVGSAIQEPGRFHNISPRFFQGAANDLPLMGLESVLEFGNRYRTVALTKDLRRQVFRTKTIGLPEDDGPANRASKFSDISRPLVLLQHTERLGVRRPEFPLGLAFKFLKEEGNKQWDVIQPFPEGWQFNWQTHSEIEVGAKIPFPDLFGQ
jgi:hypothetical protein